MGVDIFGHPMDRRIEAICQKYAIPIVEDSCEALGSGYLVGGPGPSGLAGAFAFYPNKR